LPRYRWAAWGAAAAAGRGGHRDGALGVARGTIEVLDDYPYWVAKKYGYFGDIETTLEPGPMEATATVKLVDQEQSTWAIRRPACSRWRSSRASPGLGLGDGRLRRVRHRPAEGLEGEEPGRAPGQDGGARQRRLAGDLRSHVRAGRRRSQDHQVCEAGSGWGQSLQQGQADAALSWEACVPSGRGRPRLRLPDRTQRLEVSGQHLHHASEGLRDASKKELYETYLRGWPWGSNTATRTARATHIVMQQFPSLKLAPEIATESMMELANVSAAISRSGRAGAGTTSRPGIHPYYDRSINQISRTSRPRT